MAFAANGALIEVDDGGIYRRANPRTNNDDWISMNGNLQTGELHSIAWDANSHILIAGTQDNGAPEQQATSDVRWRTVIGGDGGFVAVDDSSTEGLSIRYSSAQELLDFLYQIFDAKNVFQREKSLMLHVVDNSTPDKKIKAEFYTPIELNAVDPRRLIIGGDDSVYESED